MDYFIAKIVGHVPYADTCEAQGVSHCYRSMSDFRGDVSHPYILNLAIAMLSARTAEALGLSRDIARVSHDALA
jgi:hypothetical protein